MNILITTPSLNPSDNVSGISSVSRLLLQYNKEYNYIPFILGKRDAEKRGLSWFCSLLKIPYNLFRILHNSSIDLCHFNVGFEPRSLLRDILPYLMLSYKSIPLCLHIHGGRFMSSTPKNVFFRYVINLFLDRASQIIVLSQIEADFLRLHYRVLEKNLYIIPNSVELPELYDKKYEGVLNILYLGRIDRKKGLQAIAETLMRLEKEEIPFKFYFCGVGPDKDWFMSLLPDIVKCNVVDIGLVYGISKDNILRSSHIFLLPSLFEGLPMALLESMSYSVVPIVSSVGSMPNVVKDGYNGFLANESSEIVSDIMKIHRNRLLLSNLAQRARETIESRFSIGNYINQINEIYSVV